MELRPGYKQTEMGVIPENWDVIPLAELCHSIMDGTHFTPKYVSQGIPFYSVENITADDFTNTKFISEEEHTLLIKRCKPERGDILMTRITAGVLGDTRIIDWDVNASVYVSLALLKPNGNVVPEYLYRYSRSASFRADIEKRGLVNATPKKINMRDIGAVPVPVPKSREEQRAIAMALSNMDAFLDGLVRLIAKKRDLKQATMQQLLTGRTRLTGFTGEWETKTLGELFDFGGGYSASRDQLSTEGHCYLHYGDIHGSTKTFVDTRADYQNIPKLNIPLSKVSSKSLLDDGDVVFVDASEDDEGTSKHVVVVNKDRVPFISGLHTIVAKGKTDELNHEYRQYCFQTKAIRDQFRFYAVGTKVSGISKTNIPKLTMPVPSYAEQAAIADVLVDMDTELTALEQRLAKTRDLKQAMMQELLTGKTRLVAAEVAHA